MSFAEKIDRPSKTPEEIEVRRRAAEHARHELRLEGLTQDEFGQAVTARVIAGEIDEVEARRLLIEHYRAM